MGRLVQPLRVSGVVMSGKRSSPVVDGPRATCVRVAAMLAEHDTPSKAGLLLLAEEAGVKVKAKATKATIIAALVEAAQNLGR